MSEAPPIIAEWKGDGWVPVNPHMARLADEHFVIGERYRLVELKERSKRSHDHFFAAVVDEWTSLPEHMGSLFPSPDHMRKYCLIRAGYCDIRTYVCGTRAEAERWAGNLRPLDRYAVVEAKGTVVTVYTAHSQKNRLMDAKTFQQSKDAVFDQIAILRAAAERRAA